MELEIINTRLESQLNKEIYQKLISQVEKDFVMSGINYDFSDLNKSGYIVSTGQSGNVMSDHYDDLASKWSAIEFLKMSADALDYKRKDNAELVFSPNSQ